MKIRNGFVSNSSSSSFVVALDHEPVDVSDTLDLLFNGERYTFDEEYQDNLTTTQISELVFNDLKRTKFKRATVKDIAELFQCRYRYFVDSTTSSTFVPDEHGGCWYGGSGKYWGTDAKLLEKLRLAYVEEENVNVILRKMSEEVERGPEPVPYADAHSTCTKYTKEQIAAYKKYCKALEHFQKTDKGYLAYIKRRTKILSKRWDVMAKCRMAVAKKDAKAFMDANKGKFIFTTSYSDNNGSVGSFMEHAGIFRNVEHVQISMH